MRGRKTRTIILGAVVVAIAIMSIGFAAMSATLNIQGTAEMNPATWNIRFQNLLGPTLSGAATELIAPTVSGTGNTVISTYNVRLTRPGDKAVYTFDMANLGDIDAEITSFSKPNPICTGTGASALEDANMVCSNLVYTLQYTSGSANVAIGNTFNSNTARNVTLTIEYPLEIDELPVQPVTITAMNISIVFTQV